MDSRFSLQPLEYDRVRSYLMEHAITDMGREQIQAMTPRTNADEIARDLDEVVEMKELLASGDAFPVGDLRDIRPMIGKLRVHGMSLGPSDLLPVSFMLSTFRQIRSFMKTRSESYPLLSAISSKLHTYPEAEKRIAATVDDHGEIKDSASPALRRIRRDIAVKSSDVRRKVESLAKLYTEQGYSSEPIVTVRQGRMVIPIKDEFKYAVKGFVHDESSSGQTVFIEPAEALEINNVVRKLQLEESREIERIMAEISDLLRDDMDSIEHDTKIMARIEFIHAKARLAGRMGGHRPQLNTDGRILLRNAVHPVLLLKEMARPVADRKRVVPLNLEIGGLHRVIIISGPNAGGKTVALKTVGLLALMAQSGLLIPADGDSQMGLFDRVLADIGDDQSIDNDLSTFSSHVQHLAAMVRTADDRSLVLIDEIGGGTDPREGASLAISVLERLHRRKAVTIATTHHGELKAFAESTEGIENGSMEFDQHSLRPTYVYRHGIPGSSYALEISRRMGLDQDVIARAKEISGQDIQRTEELIQNLQTQVRDYEQRLADLANEKSRLENLQKLYEERAEEAAQKNRALRKDMIEAKRNILLEANARIEQVIEELKRTADDRQAGHRARTTLRRELAETSDELRQLEMDSRKFHPVQSVHPGDRVYIPDMDLEGVVIERPDASGQALVGVGSLTIRLRLDQLAQKDEAQTPTKRPAAASRVEWDTDGVGTELDLRGLTGDEALDAVHTYLGDARALGFDQITLIHGKGSGILRKRIAEFLKHDRRVLRYRLGQWGEGDTGVTIVEMRKD